MHSSLCSKQTTESEVQSEQLSQIKASCHFVLMKFFHLFVFSPATRLKCHVHPSSSPSLLLVINSISDRTASTNQTEASSPVLGHANKSVDDRHAT